MAELLTAICEAGYYRLRQLHPIVRSLSGGAARTLVHAFVLSHLDCCDTLLCGISDGPFHRLQSVQNAAARLVTGSAMRPHFCSPATTALARSKAVCRLQTGCSRLHVVASSSPPYVADDCQCQLVTYSECCHLHSRDINICIVL